MQDYGPFEMLSGGFGSSLITGMDAISFPPLMVTSAEDKMVGESGRCGRYDAPDSAPS